MNQEKRGDKITILPGMKFTSQVARMRIEVKAVRAFQDQFDVIVRTSDEHDYVMTNWVLSELQKQLKDGTWKQDEPQVNYSVW